MWLGLHRSTFVALLITAGVLLCANWPTVTYSAEYFPNARWEGSMYYCYYGWPHSVRIVTYVELDKLTGKRRSGFPINDMSLEATIELTKDALFFLAMMTIVWLGFERHESHFSGMKGPLARIPIAGALPFRLHLSTALFMMFVASGLLWANLNGSFFWADYSWQQLLGFPIVAARKNNYGDDEFRIDYWCAALDFLIATSAILATWVLCECWIARRLKLRSA